MSCLYLRLQVRGTTPLMCAGLGGHVECVRLLLDWGAGVDVASVSRWLVVRTHRVAWTLCGVRRELVDVFM
jgi:hypothetical protein